MKGSLRSAIPVWVVAGCWLGGCGNGQTGAPTAEAGPEGAGAPVVHERPVAEEAAVEPVELDRSEGYQAELVRAAMRGITYEGGVLAIDQEAARTIVDGPDAEASAAALAEGRRLIASNHREEAIAAMTRAVLQAPTSAAALEGLGDALTVRRKYTQAAAAFRAAIEQAPDEPGPHFKLADMLVRLNDREQAIAELRRTLALDPDHAKARERLALQLYYTGRPAEAWEQVHRTEARGHQVPPQFRALLAQAQPEPAGPRGEER